MSWGGKRVNRRTKQRFYDISSLGAKRGQNWVQNLQAPPTCCEVVGVHQVIRLLALLGGFDLPEPLLESIDGYHRSRLNRSYFFGHDSGHEREPTLANNDIEEHPRD